MGGFVVLAVTPVVVGLVAGYLGGGRLSRLPGGLRHLWLLWLAVAAQAAQLYLGLPLLGVVFALVLAWLVANARQWPRSARLAAGLVVAGALLNGLAIAANGRMPYSPRAAAAAGLSTSEVTAKNQPATNGTQLAVLGDVLAISPIRKVVSVGDVAIGAGTAWLVAVLMRRRNPEDETGEGGDR